MQTHRWPGAWTRVAPRVDDHPECTELAWMVRGGPFTRPVIARSSVGVRQTTDSGFERFVYVEVMADGLHGMGIAAFDWFRQLEWLGPVVLPGATT